jgi:hypothetical protein
VYVFAIVPRSRVAQFEILLRISPNTRAAAAMRFCHISAPRQLGSELKHELDELVDGELADSRLRLHPLDIHRNLKLH